VPVGVRLGQARVQRRWNIYAQSLRRRSDFPIAEELIFVVREMAGKLAVDSLPRNDEVRHKLQGTNL
jgi:hypothetical protein